jgi:hypothetical protein
MDVGFQGDTVEKVENRTSEKIPRSRFLDVPTAAKPCMADTKVRSRFCAKR